MAKLGRVDTGNLPPDPGAMILVFLAKGMMEWLAQEAEGFEVEEVYRIELSESGQPFSDGIPLCKIAIKERNSMLVDTADRNEHIRSNPTAT